MVRFTDINFESFELVVEPPEDWTHNITDPDVTCLSWWFPRIKSAGVTVPKTQIVAVGDVKALAAEIYDPVEKTPHVDALAGLLAAYGDDFGWPCFLRTGHFSGKHNWKKTCYCERREDVANQISEIAYMQEMAMLLPRNPLSLWVIREMLPTTPQITCTRYGDFPVTRERRVFVENGRVAYSIPYWPDDAIEQGRPSEANWEERLPGVLSFTNAELAEVHDLAAKAGAAVGCPGHERWSVDVLETTRGWCVTDLAEAGMSYGYDGAKYSGETDDPLREAAK